MRGAVQGGGFRGEIGSGEGSGKEGPGEERGSRGGGTERADRACVGDQHRSRRGKTSPAVLHRNSEALSFSGKQVEENTAGLGQKLRTGRPLVGGFSFHGVSGLCTSSLAHRLPGLIQAQGMRRRPMQA